VARADHAAVSLGGQVIVLGGGRGGVADPAVWATRDGITFTPVARLATPVRYGAAAVAGGLVYLFGGTAGRGDTSLISVLDPVRGTDRVAGHLPRTLTGATAFVLDGRILVAGGMHAGAPVTTILAFDPATGRVRTVGHLPEPRAFAAVAVVGGVAYLVGGETGHVYLDTVVAIRAAA
jgi:N-acetylneuraminic acid mutarotase